MGCWGKGFRDNNGFNVEAGSRGKGGHEVPPTSDIHTFLFSGLQPLSSVLPFWNPGAKMNPKFVFCANRS